jgi:hypothetical protein
MSVKNKEHHVVISSEYVGEDDKGDLGLLFAVRTTHEACYTDEMLGILIGTPEKERINYLKTLPPLGNEPLLMLAMFVSDWMFRAKSTPVAKQAIQALFNQNIFDTLSEADIDWFGTLLLMVAQAGQAGVESLVSFSIVEKKVFKFYLDESLKVSGRINATNLLIDLDTLGDHDEIKAKMNVSETYFQPVSANDEAQ